MTPTESEWNGFTECSDWLAGRASNLKEDVGVDHILWGSDFPHDVIRRPNSQRCWRLSSLMSPLGGY
jgi:predicted TIM-barrel fold metal-dependent hydrolase